MPISQHLTKQVKHSSMPVGARWQERSDMAPRLTAKDLMWVSTLRSVVHSYMLHDAIFSMKRCASGVSEEPLRFYEEVIQPLWRHPGAVRCC